MQREGAPGWAWSAEPQEPLEAGLTGRPPRFVNHLLICSQRVGHNLARHTRHIFSGESPCVFSVRVPLRLLPHWQNEMFGTCGGWETEVSKLLSNLFENRQFLNCRVWLKWRVSMKTSPTSSRRPGMPSYLHWCYVPTTQGELFGTETSLLWLNGSYLVSWVPGD